MRQIAVIAHNIRSCHNVGSLMRTADGLGVQRIYLTGYTPYPAITDDTRLPYVASRNHKSISKTSLGAEENVDWRHNDSVISVIDELQTEGFIVFALEQSKTSIPLTTFSPPERVAILLGEEVKGVPSELLSIIQNQLEIPMFGHKESFNVVEAATMAMYHCRFHE